MYATCCFKCRKTTKKDAVFDIEKLKAKFSCGNLIVVFVSLKIGILERTRR